MAKMTTLEILTGIKNWVLGKFADLFTLIPYQASPSNQLADKAFVNSSIATATATFRGTYNVVTDLLLTPSATPAQIATALGTAVSTKDNNDYCFVQIPTSSSTPTEIARIDRYKYNGTAFSLEYTLNNSGFTAEQWAAINSGVTSGDMTKLRALPTSAELTTLLNGKQDVIQDLADIRSGASAGSTAVQPATLSSALSNTVAESGVFDLSAYNNGTTYADLNAALTALNALQDAYKKGGMSIKFVQSSDNKYVLYFLTEDEWSVNESDWEKMNLEEEVRQLDQKLTEIPIYKTLEGRYIGYTNNIAVWKSSQDNNSRLYAVGPYKLVVLTASAMSDGKYMFLNSDNTRLVYASSETPQKVSVLAGTSVTVQVPENAKYIYTEYIPESEEYLSAFSGDGIAETIINLDLELEKSHTIKKDFSLSFTERYISGNTKQWVVGNSVRGCYLQEVSDSIKTIVFFSTKNVQYAFLSSGETTGAANFVSGTDIVEVPRTEGGTIVEMEIPTGTKYVYFLQYYGGSFGVDAVSYYTDIDNAIDENSQHIEEVFNNTRVKVELEKTVILESYISGTTKEWATSSNYNSFLVAVEDGVGKIGIVPGQFTCQYALLKNNSTTGIASFADGTDIVTISNPVEIELPEDAKYIYFLVTSEQSQVSTSYGVESVYAISSPSILVPRITNLEEKFITPNEIDFSDYEPLPLAISSNTVVWINNPTYNCYLIPVFANTRYIFSGAKKIQFCFLKSKRTDIVDLATDSQIKEVAANTTIDIVSPADAKYLYFLNAVIEPIKYSRPETLIGYSFLYGVTILINELISHDLQGLHRVFFENGGAIAQGLSGGQYQLVIDENTNEIIPIKL